MPIRLNGSSAGSLAASEKACVALRLGLGHINRSACAHAKPAFNTKNPIVSKQNCRDLNPGQFCLDTIEFFVLKAGFAFVWLTLSLRTTARPLYTRFTN
jgi:hypothetical protein